MKNSDWEDRVLFSRRLFRYVVSFKQQFYFFTWQTVTQHESERKYSTVLQRPNLKIVINFWEWSNKLRLSFFSFNCLIQAWLNRNTTGCEVANSGLKIPISTVNLKKLQLNIVYLITHQYIHVDLSRIT